MLHSVDVVWISISVGCKTVWGPLNCWYLTSLCFSGTELRLRGFYYLLKCLHYVDDVPWFTGCTNPVRQSRKTSIVQQWVTTSLVMQQRPVLPNKKPKLNHNNIAGVILRLQRFWALRMHHSRDRVQWRMNKMDDLPELQTRNANFSDRGPHWPFVIDSRAGR
jgi:hypothetical protein